MKRFENLNFGKRLDALYKNNGIDTAHRGWALKVAEELFNKDILNYEDYVEKKNVYDADITESKTKCNVAALLRRHLKYSNRSIPDTNWIFNYCEYFDCSADYLLGFQEEPRAEIASASVVTGLDYKSIEMLKKIADSNNPFYALNRMNLDMLDKILSSYYDTLMESKSDQKTYHTIFRYMWDYIHSADYIVNLETGKESYIPIQHKEDADFSQIIHVNSLVPDYMSREIIKYLDNLK